MRAWVDLHIHSCLSPCAEDEMTPWNLVGMAKVKGLQVIAVTDHNACGNVAEAMKAGAEYGVAVLPGMELNTREEVHALAYFPTLELALAAQSELYPFLPGIPNTPELFGNQLLIGAEDEVVGKEDKLLISALELGLDECAALVKRHGGLLVPAHINRGSNGMLGALGMMPPLPDYPLVEAYAGVACPDAAIKGRRILHSSDAHRLEAISEPEFALPCERAEAPSIFETLCRMSEGHLL